MAQRYEQVPLNLSKGQVIKIKLVYQSISWVGVGAPAPC